MNVNKDIKYRDVEDAVSYKRCKNYYVGWTFSITLTKGIVCNEDITERGSK